MRSKIRVVFTLAFGLMPSSKVKNLLLRASGNSVHSSASIGPSLIWRVKRFSAGPGARIGGFNVFRDMNAVVLEVGARVGSWNWISAAVPFLRMRDENGVLNVGDYAAITSRHYLDCSGGISVGRFSIVAGQRSTILTHGIDFASSRQTAAGVDIGSYSFVSTNCTLLKGASLPDRSVLAAGGVLSRSKSGELAEGLWGGVPARFLKPVDGDFFDRTVPYVAAE